MIFAAKHGWIGVDIGTCSLKLAQMERRGRQTILRSAAIIERASLVDTSPWIRSAPARVASELERGLDKARFHGRDTACTPPIAICDIRNLSIPFESEKESRAAVASELSQIHSVNEENLHFDIWRSGVSRDVDEVSVLCMADRWTDSIVADHSEHGLTCRAIDGLPQALVRAAAMHPDYQRQQPLVLLDWGATTTTFCVALNDQPIFVRCLPKLGFLGYEEKIIQALGMSRRETRRIMSRYGVPENTNDSSDEVTQTIAEIVGGDLQTFVEELTRTISYFKTQHTNLPLEHGLLFGAGAMLNNVNHWLGSKLKVDLQTWKLQFEGPVEKSHWPIELLGPAIAASSLAWEAA